MTAQRPQIWPRLLRLRPGSHSCRDLGKTAPGSQLAMKETRGEAPAQHRGAAVAVLSVKKIGNGRRARSSSRAKSARRASKLESEASSRLLGTASRGAHEAKPRKAPGPQLEQRLGGNFQKLRHPRDQRPRQGLTSAHGGARTDARSLSEAKPAEPGAARLLGGPKLREPAHRRPDTPKDMSDSAVPRLGCRKATTPRSTRMHLFTERPNTQGKGRKGSDLPVASKKRADPPASSRYPTTSDELTQVFLQARSEPPQSKAAAAASKTFEGARHLCAVSERALL